MSRIWSSVCLVLLLLSAAPPASAANLIEEPFDPAPLSVPETRLLQLALAATGDYSGPTDGVWGDASAAALDLYAAREFGTAALNAHAAALVLGFVEEVEASGWDYRYLPDLGVSLALPLARLGAEESEEGGRRWWIDDGRMTLLVHSFDEAGTQAWHRAAARAGGSSGRTETGADRIETRGVLRDGRDFFTRSDRVDGEWATVFLAAEPDQIGAMNLAAQTLAPGQPQPWSLPEDGRLVALVSEAEALMASRVPELAAPWDTAPVAPRAAALPRVGNEGTSTGSGFYLGARILVTAQHVVEGCTRVTLADGRDLELVAGDADLDVAVLRSPEPARHWLTLADSDLRLGQQIHAAGFPYYAIAGTSLNLTSGNVSALAGVDDDSRFFTFSAPVQPGNSGGPLVDSRGGVRGIVVARLSEDYIAETTGSLPQNMNYALGEAELARFLSEHDVAAARGGIGGYDMADGAPAGFGEAVIPIVCH